MNLDYLFKPQSIALVGATDKGGFGRAAALNMLHSKARTYYINPGRETLLSKPCYPTLADLPEVVEAVVICVPSAKVPVILRQAGTLGVKAAVIYSSGFAEEHSQGGMALETEVIGIARKFGMVLLGPNCMGIYSRIDHTSMWAGNVCWPHNPPLNGIGLIAQSGFVISQFTDMPAIACAVSTGNGNMVTLEDVFERMVSDDRVGVVAMYIEGLRKPELFRRTLKQAAEINKPVVMLKAGTSDSGAKAASSHTASMAGSAAAFAALMEKYGVISVDNIQALKSMAELMAVTASKRLRAEGFAFVNYSGGENILSADMAEKYAIPLPALQPPTVEALDQVLPRFAFAGNPMDVTTEMLYVKEKMASLLFAFQQQENIGCLVIGSNIEAKGNLRNDTLLEAITHARGLGLELPILIVPTLEGTRSAVYRANFATVNAILMPSASVAYSLIGTYVRHYTDEVAKRNLTIPPNITYGSDERLQLSEYDSRQRLHGLSDYFQPTSLVKDVTGLDELESRIPFPWAMKINSADIAHKSDIGGVRLKVSDINCARDAFQEILDRVASAVPEAGLDGVLVSGMVGGGVELILGTVRDPQTGPMLLVGMGGILAEVYKDTKTALCPVSHVEALGMLSQLKLYDVLTGVRGMAACDLDTLAQLMVSLSELACDTPGIAEIDLNPVAVMREGVVILDALVVCNIEDQPDEK